MSDIISSMNKYFDSHALFSAQGEIAGYDILNKVKEIAAQKLFCGNLGYNFDCEVERKKLDAEKAECESLKKRIEESTCDLNGFEVQLDTLQNKKEKLNSDFKSIDDRVSDVKHKLNKLKRVRKTGSRDSKKVNTQRNLLKFYESLFKVKICLSSNCVHGFIYNDTTTYVKNFIIPLSKDTAWDLLTPAAHLSWTIDSSDDETDSDLNLKSKHSAHG